MRIIIICEECTQARRKRHDNTHYPPVTMDSLSAAIMHYNEYSHELSIEIEQENSDE